MPEDFNNLKHMESILDDVINHLNDSKLTLEQAQAKLVQELKEKHNYDVYSK